jgi:hypothetical protein
LGIWAGYAWKQLKSQVFEVETVQNGFRVCLFRYQGQKNNRRNLKDLNSTLLSDNGDALGKKSREEQSRCK